MIKYFFALTLIVGCKNPNYCADHLDNNCNEGKPADAGDGSGSGSNQFDCTQAGMSCATGVCDMETKACVACTADDNTACAVTTPICRANQCTACASNNDCPESNTCLPSGACAASSDVAYVKSTGTDTGQCTQFTPCATVTFALGLAHPYVHLTGAITESVIVPMNVTKTIIGERDAAGTMITSTIGNPASGATLMTVNGTTTNLSLVDIALQGVTGNGDALSLSTTTATTKVSLLRCLITGVDGYGINASHGEVDLDRSSVTRNASGGVNLSQSVFHINNSFITKNGAGGNGIGGIYASQGSGTVAFTTVANNLGAAGAAKGIACSGTSVAVASSIFSNNSNSQNSGDGCTFTYSDFNPSDVNTPAGGNNLTADPLLDGTTYHLMAGSQMKDAADPNATLKIDWDGDDRPQGPARDIGADEMQ